MITETPSSVLQEPIVSSTASAKFRVGNFEISEPQHHRRRAGTSVRNRMLAIRDFQEQSETKINIAKDGEYTTIQVIESDAESPKSISVNGTHIKVTDGIDSAKFDFSGNRLAIEPRSGQLNLLDGIVLDQDEPFQIPIPGFPKAVRTLPESFSPRIGDFLKEVAAITETPQANMEPDMALRLSTIFAEINGKEYVRLFPKKP